MVIVKFFGLISIDNNVNRISVKAGSIRQVIDEISTLHEINISKLEQAIMFVNRTEIQGGKRLSLMLEDGDELVFLTPSSGG